ncbi:MAG: DsrE family protein [Nitrospira sp.]|nr:DsrE family protein [Nitrospira sp.]
MRHSQKLRWMLLSLACTAGMVLGQPPWGAGADVAPENSRPHRVVLHLNSGDEKVQRGALNNIKNLYQEFSPQSLRVELVVHGAGLPLLIKKGTPFAAELTELRHAYGVNYTACSNTMKTMKVTREDLVDEVGDTVPAMVRLLERQEQGWAYIKP